MRTQGDRWKRQCVEVADGLDPHPGCPDPVRCLIRFRAVDATNGRPFLSIAAPARNEIVALPELYRRVQAVANGLCGDEWELVIADDGSSDGTRELLRDLAERDPHVKVVLLSRNFGHTPAYLAALAHTSGTWNVLMDSDLQDEPEVIPQMVGAAGTDMDVVYAIKSKPTWRASSCAVRFSLDDWLAGHLSSVPLSLPTRVPFCIDEPPGGGDDRDDARAQLLLPRSAGLCRLSPDRDTRRAPWLRAAGNSRIAVRRRIAGALDGLLAFSTAPLRLAAWLGLIVAVLTSVMELFFVFFKLFADVTVPGFTALVTLILFLGEVQLFTLGIVGEYLGKVYDEVKRRPRYIVEERLNVEAETGPGERRLDVGV